MTTKFWWDILQSLRAVTGQFPREVALAFAAMVSIMVQVENTGEVERIALHLGLAFILAMNLSLALTIVVRSGKLGSVIGWVIWLAVTSALTWFVFALDFDKTIDVVQYAYLIVLVHMLVVSSWISFGSVERFWSAVIAMFHRILFAVLFTSVLQLGLTLVVSSVRLLFGFEGISHLEAHIAIFAFFLFNTLFFLSGLPPPGDLDRKHSIDPMPLIFVRFVLAPLVFLFLVILWAYGAKLVFGGLTEEITAYVLVLTGFAIFAILLTWSERDVQGFPWRILHRYTLTALVPLLGVATWAWIVRLQSKGIDDTGFTVAALLAVAVLIVATSVLKRRLDPRVPAIAFVIVLCITTAGPFGVSAVSERSIGPDSSGSKPEVLKKAVKGEIDSVRTSSPARFLITYGTGDTWSASFALSDVDDDDVVITTSADGAATISFPRLSTLVTLVYSVRRDTIVFDAKDLLADNSDSLRVIERSGNGVRTIIMATDATLVRRNGQWAISRLAATTFTTSLKSSK
ncbi:MAG: DUF4153 domain-containing protein [Candidatus Kapabacteria bacterium]|nr:DUF4153 domain-containing protein [Candidatus Kapabacteria bacterium]